MTDLNKEREAFEEAYLSVGGKQRELEFEDGEYANSKSQLGWELWQIKAKAQAVPDTHIVVPRTREVVVAIEKMVEQQVEASGITSDVFRLDGWRILDAIQEASESGAEG